jgi:hypothetical protein
MMAGVTDMEFYDGKLGWINTASFDDETKNQNDGDPSYLIPMQYTGLHDSNGQKIYEGDVLECISFTYGNGETKTGNFLVQYHEMSAGFIAGPYMLGKIMDIRKCKVAGNIYENPELLEVRHDN